jgi:hypothetical protein
LSKNVAGGELPDQLDRPHGDARLIHRNNEADAIMVPARGIRAPAQHRSNCAPEVQIFGH